MPPVKSDLPTMTPPGQQGGLPLPLYEHVKQLILDGILVGTWPPGAVLPGEVALAAHFGVAVGTVRRALADLVSDGQLMRRRKTGTVVTGRVPMHNLRNFFQYFRLHGADGGLLHSETEVLALRREAPTLAEIALFPDADAGMLRLHRLRHVKGRPVMHEWMMLPAARLPDFPEVPPPLLYRFLVDRYGIRVSAVRESVTASLATEEDLTLLQLEGPAALLAIQEAAYDQAGAPIIASQHRVVTEGLCYLNELR